MSATMSATMPAAAAEISVVEDGFAGSGYAGRHALLPILMGLAAPMLLFMLFEPRALQHGKLMLYLMLIAIFVVAVVVCVVSILNPGNLMAARFDARGRTVELVYQGSFANRVVQLEFQDLAGVAMERVYDDDGYDSLAAVLRLADGQAVQLPSTTTADDVAHIKACLAAR